MADKRVAIVGVATTEFARQIPDRTKTELWVQAAKGAVEDAGITMKDVDGLLAPGTGGSGARYDNPRVHMELGEILGIYEKSLCINLMTGGASGGHAVEIARWALQNRRCEYVLVVAGSKESDHGRSTRGHGMTDRLALLTMHYPEYEHPYGPLMPSFYAVCAQRHMHEYGTTEEQLASIPVAIRHNASLNPAAVYQTPITVEDVLNSKMISSPLHMLHCCAINDGAMAYVLTTEERAYDGPNKPVWVLGSGGGQSGYWTGFLANGGADKGYSLVRTQAKLAADQAFAEAGVTRDEIDFVNCCDNFAITPLILLEDYGFCAKGEGGEFIGPDGDNIKVGGGLPVNTHGGALSCNHAGINYHNYVEATVQLRGDAGARQVTGAKMALAGATAGIISTHYATVLGAD
jgi:acetyl-CoA acetyltransferase